MTVWICFLWLVVFIHTIWCNYISVPNGPTFPMENVAINLVYTYVISRKVIAYLLLPQRETFSQGRDRSGRNSFSLEWQVTYCHHSNRRKHVGVLLHQSRINPLPTTKQSVSSYITNSCYGFDVEYAAGLYNATMPNFTGNRCCRLIVWRLSSLGQIAQNLSHSRCACILANVVGLSSSFNLEKIHESVIILFISWNMRLLLRIRIYNILLIHVYTFTFSTTMRNVKFLYWNKLMLLLTHKKKI